MKTEYLIMLSEIVDKMDIKEELKSMEINTGNEEKDNEELGKQLIALMITRIYKCKNEIYAFVASYRGYLPQEEQYEIDPLLDEDYTEEKEKELKKQYRIAFKEAIKKAKDEDIVKVFKEISKLDGVKSFLSVA